MSRLSYRISSFAMIIMLLTSIIVTNIAYGIDADLTEKYEKHTASISDQNSFITTRSGREGDIEDTWSEPPLKRILGDDFSERAIFVHQNDTTFLDDLLFCAAVPAAVHWEGSTRYDSMIISDANIRENGNLIGDYSEYLRKIEATPDIDIIGPVEEDRQYELASYFENVDQINTVTLSDNVYEGACDIASYYWKNRRDLGTDTAVLAYVPEGDGGREVREIMDGGAYGQFQMYPEIDAMETSWIRYQIEWEDPQADTDYRIAVRDPYALQPNLYSNQGEEGHVNPTNNKLFDHEGYAEIGMAPYYSFMPYSIETGPSNGKMLEFTGNISKGDGSVWPLPNGTDHMTFQFGPVRQGQWIGIITNWTYYNSNETIYRDLNTYIYEPGQEIGPEYHLEIVTNSGSYTENARNTPESGYCYAEKDGYYNLTIHPYVNSVGGVFHTRVHWGSVDKDSSWPLYQLNNGNDPAYHELLEYNRIPDEVSESVTNGAVVASLENIPLFYSAGGVPEPEVIGTLNDFGISNLIIIDPGNEMDHSRWGEFGFDVFSYLSDKEVFNLIHDISTEKGLDRSVVIPAQGGPWFSGAALGGAYHGAPVPALDDDDAKWIQIRATTSWWQVIQDAVSFRKAPLNEYAAPGQIFMEELSDDIFDWLGEFNIEYSPLCGDSNSDGVPDNGRNWDYSDDIDVLVISPMNALKPIFDRAITGKASVGRITPAEPEVLWAILNREMLYWKVGFSQADDPQNPIDQKPVADHWKVAGWTFNTYAHDDDIMDNDAGDQDDDDWCGVDDGGSNHLQYKTREDLPSYADSSGRISKYHTYYDDILGMLERGTLLWSNHGHGHAYWMLETGPGFTGTGVDSSDPPWGTPVPENGFVDPPLEVTSGWDWYYGLDSVHSTFSTYQSCQVGGSAMAEYFLRMGGIGVIGGFVTRSLVEATIQSDRTTQGLLVHNMTFGEAHRWGQDETGPIYSLHDPGPVHHTYHEYGYPDDVEFRYGDTGQTILYGDPSLRILAPTIFATTEIFVDETGRGLVIALTIKDQSGNLIDPDSVKISVDGEEILIVKDRIGRYLARSTITEGVLDYIVIVDLQDGRFLSPGGSHDFEKTYHLHLPTGNLLPGEIYYTGGRNQILRSDGPACIPDIYGRAVEPEEVNNITISVLTMNGERLGPPNDLIHNGSFWIMKDLNVSSLPEGEYVIELRMRLKYHPDVVYRGLNFEVEHGIYFEGEHYEISRDTKILTLRDLRIYSTFLLEHEGPSYCTYDLFIRPERGDPSKVISGNLVKDDIRDKYGFQLDMSVFSLGTYYIVVKTAFPYTPEALWTSDDLIIDLPVQISDFTVSYTGGMDQLVHVENIQFFYNSDRNDPIPPEDIISAQCEILYPDMDETGNAIGLSHEGGGWNPVDINVSSLKNGEYIICIEVSTTEFGTNSAFSFPFNVKHEVIVKGPNIQFDPENSILDLLDIDVYSSHMNAEILPISIMIKRESSEFSMDITNSLVFSGGSWQVRNLDVTSILPEGEDYYVELSFWADGAVERSVSEQFSIYYELIIYMPDIRFNQEYDLIDVSRIEVRSTFDRVVALTSEELATKVVRVFNSSSNDLLLEYELLYSGGKFHREISRPMDKFGEGDIYIEIIFATVLSGNYSTRSKDIRISVQKIDIITDDDVVDDNREKDQIPWVIIMIIVIVIISTLVVASISIFLGKMRRQGSSRFNDGSGVALLEGNKRSVEGLDLPPTHRGIGTTLDKGHQLPAPNAVYYRPGAQDNDDISF